MKGIGLAGAGLGTAAATAPVFHDLDEVTAASSANWKRPWWVSSQDNPSNEIDWNLMQRLDQREVNNFMPGRGPNPTQEGIDIRANNTEFVAAWCKERYYPEWGGTTTRDVALSEAASAASDPYSPGYGTPFNGMGIADTPEEAGIPKWTGTPEENMKTVRAAFRTLGANDVACFELTQEKRKIIFSYQQRSGELPLPLTTVRNKKIDFENVDHSYFTSEKMVIPDKARYMIVWTALMTPELVLREGSTVGKSATRLAYNRCSFVNTHVIEFVRALGYDVMSAYRAHLSPAAPRGVLSGVGEHNRMCFPTMHPEVGHFNRTVNGILTDLPVAPTKPIDAGMYKFCEACGICSDACPYGALPKGDPDWESEFGASHSIHAGNTPGYVGYRMDVTHCTKCGVCQGMCPFNSIGESFIHTLVKGTVGMTSIFNGFFTNMEETFGYGIKNPEEWWDLSTHWGWGFPPSFIA
jgi:reductive dehalogenase